MRGQSQKVETVLQRIRFQTERLTKIATQSLTPGQPFGHVDLLVVGAVKKTLCLASGFSSLVRSSNMFCARALLRMQLDIATRFGAIAIVDDAEEFARCVFGGTEIRKLKSSEGKLLTDAYLVKRLSQFAPWLPDVYRDTSDYVHFSASSIFAGIGHLDDETHTVLFAVNDRDDKFPESTWLVLTGYFEKQVHLLIGLVRAWAELRTPQKMLVRTREVREA